MKPLRVARRVRLTLRAFEAAAAFQALAGGARQAFLIERGGWGGEPETACLGWGPAAVFRLSRGRLVALGARALSGLHPLAALGRSLQAVLAARAGPAWAGGAVGYLAYEVVRHVEPIPARPHLAEEGLLMVFDRALTHDYRTGATELVLWDRSAAAAREEAAVVEKALLAVVPSLRVRGEGRVRVNSVKLTSSLGRSGYMAGVRRLKEHIRAGDIFQAVLSDQFRASVRPGDLALYRALRTSNPSPYHFLLRDGGQSFVGASPERLIKVEGRLALYSPIAGTRPRSPSASRDRRLEAALKRSPKERAEHLMLVDLGRNDLGRVCRPGTIRVSRFMDVRRFSRVMHLVSELEGRLERGKSAWDALEAAFPAGTVTGAPKVRAMQLLHELEPAARGFYAGAVVQLDPLGNLDSCISLRSIRLTPSGAVLQAGAGIVADSNPAREYREVLDKLEAGRRALAAAALL